MENPKLTLADTNHFRRWIEATDGRRRIYWPPDWKDEFFREPGPRFRIPEYERTQLPEKRRLPRVPDPGEESAQ